MMQIKVVILRLHDGVIDVRIRHINPADGVSIICIHLLNLRCQHLRGCCSNNRYVPGFSHSFIQRPHTSKSGA